MLAMEQPIAGVTPPESREMTVMTIYPSMAATEPGRLIGRLCGIQVGYSIFTLGNLFALLLIPFALGLFVSRLLPGIISRYRLTNRRVVIERGLRHAPERWVDFARFDTIAVEVLPGQEWYPAGELIFRRDAIETFRLSGVLRPETFRHTCLAARRAYLGAREAQ
jgi:hypothetical protein